MKKVLKKMVGLLMATIMIGSMLVGSVSAAEVEVQVALLSYAYGERYVEAQVDGVIADGYFHESEYRSAPCFDLQIDGISLLDTAF